MFPRGYARPAGFRQAAWPAWGPGGRVATILLACGFAAGCTSVAPFRGVPLSGDMLYVSGLPPLRQDEHFSCGPACVAALSVHWGVSLEEFKRSHPTAPRDATGAELRRMAESLGLQAFLFQGSPGDLRDNLRRGRPMIVMMTKPPDPALRGAGLLGRIALAVSERVSHPPHWVVVVGMLGDREVIVHDPAAGPLQIKRALFEEWWARHGNVCVLIVRK